MLALSKRVAQNVLCLVGVFLILLVGFLGIIYLLGEPLPKNVEKTPIGDVDEGNKVSLLYMSDEVVAQKAEAEEAWRFFEHTFRKPIFINHKEALSFYVRFQNNKKLRDALFSAQKYLKDNQRRFSLSDFFSVNNDGNVVIDITAPDEEIIKKLTLPE